MQLFENLKKAFSKEPFNAQQAQEMAHLYSWGPVIFQVCRLMVKYGILENLSAHPKGLTQQEIAQAAGLGYGDFIHTLGDAHIYKNHIEQCRLQLTREPRPLPTMHINPDKHDIFGFDYDDFTLTGYDPHPHIKGEVSV